MTKPDLILVQRKSSRPLDETLGHQFLFGAIPLTRLKLAHGADDYLLEVAIQVAHENGFTPLVVSSEALPEIIKIYPSPPQLELEYRTLSVSGYDLIFLRELSSSGTIAAKISERVQGGDNFSRAMLESFDQTQYGSAAQAPALEYLLRRGTADAIGKIYRSLRRHRLNECAVTDSSNSNAPIVTFISKPSLGVDTRQKIESDNLPQKLFATYGFNGLTAGPDTISRLVQRGVSETFSKRDLPWGAMPDNALLSSPCRGAPEPARLAENITSIEYVDGGSFSPDTLKGTFLFSLRSPATDSAVESICTGEIQIESSKDGAGIFAVEGLAAHLMEQYLSSPNGDNGRTCVPVR